MQVVNTNSLKQVILLFLITCLITPLNAQNARNETGTINSKKFQGFSIIIADEQDKVSDFWINELRKNGKLRRKRDFYQIEQLNLPDEYYPEAIYYTRVRDRDSTSSKIWIALDPESLLAGESGQENADLALENYVGSLKVAYEKYLIELQIADAQRASTFTSRQQQRLIQEGRNLEFQLSESKAEKERLLESIEKLELEILALSQRIDDNKAAVEQSNVDLEKISKMLDQYRENLIKLQE